MAKNANKMLHEKILIREQLYKEKDELSVTLHSISDGVITNMFKHAFPDHRKGEITISLSRNTEMIMLTIADNGIGIDKNINPLKSKSMGLRTVNNIVKHQLKGKISYNSDIGLEYKISLKDDQHKQRV